MVISHYPGGPCLPGHTLSLDSLVCSIRCRPDAHTRFPRLRGVTATRAVTLQGRRSRPAVPHSALCRSSLTGWRCGQRGSCAGIRHLGAGSVAARPRQFRQRAQGLGGRETHRQRPAAARGAPARALLGCPGSLFARRDSAEPWSLFPHLPKVLSLDLSEHLDPHRSP